MSDHEPLRDRILNGLAKFVARHLPHRVLLYAVLHVWNAVDKGTNEEPELSGVGHMVMRWMEHR